MFKSSRFSLDRERRYPVLSAFDLSLHFALSALVVALTLVVLGALVVQLMPGLDARVMGLIWKLRG